MRLLLFLSVAVLLSACATSHVGNVDAEWRASPNFSPRRPNFVIVHHTGSDSEAMALALLTSPFSGVSSHYLIGPSGKVWQLVDENQRAWHAGVSFWGGVTDLNSASIGIELVNDGVTPFPEAQIESLLHLLGDIMTRYAIPRAHVLGHGDIAPARKSDPSGFFPWRRLAGAGFGLWCDDAEAAAYTPSSDFDERLALAAFGYDLADFAATLAAFRRHFSDGNAEPETSSPDPLKLSASERARLACLLARGQEQRE